MTPDELKASRLALGLTQANLAAKLGVSREAYNAWEKGRAVRGVPEHASMAVIKLLGITDPASKPAAILSPKTRPDLYSDPRRGHRNSLHPRHLLSPAALAPFEQPGGALLLSVLELPEYLAAIARQLAAPQPAESFSQLVERTALAELAADEAPAFNLKPYGG